MGIRWHVLACLVAAGCSGGSSSKHADAAVADAATDSGCGAPTTISGVVYAPNGTLPLPGVDVYIPSQDPGPWPAGLLCNRCSGTLPGVPVGAPAKTDDMGRFALTGTPSGANIPLVIAIGKWRRIITIPVVQACANTSPPAADLTLPKSRDDMTANTKSIDLPRIAITTGAGDSLECLIRKLGIADKEITTNGAPGVVNLYAGNGVAQFDVGFAGGSGTFAPASTVDYGAAAGPYDLLMLSCEQAQNPTTKPQAALDAMKAYADGGGRVIASHFHNIWIAGENGNPTHGVPEWQSLATWDFGSTTVATAVIDETSAKGSTYASWMLAVQGSTTRDLIPLATLPNPAGFTTATAVDPTKAERWAYPFGTTRPQVFQFTAPNAMPPAQRCGKVTFTDFHLPRPGTGNYPSSCSTGPLTQQEIAIAFMFFEAFSCVRDN